MTDPKADALAESMRRVAQEQGIAVDDLSSHSWRRRRRRDEPSEHVVKRLGGWNAAKAMVTGTATPTPCKVARSLPSIFEPDDDMGGPTVAEVPRRYIVSWAQNATPIHDNLWASLRAFCEYMGAELLVIAGRYRNPTSLWSKRAEDDERWDERLGPYLIDGRQRLASDLVVFGDISIQPTAVRPLTDFEVFAGQSSAIFGHPKIQLRVVAGSKREEARIFTTTGACTIENYTPTKAGRKAEAHHIFGAALVEVLVDGRWFVRQINATSDGEFDDLGLHFSPYGVDLAERPLALVMGDIHAPAVDDAVIDATFHGADSIVGELQPAEVILHDVCDFRARNHHGIKDPDEAFARMLGDIHDSVEAELEEVVDFIESVPEGPAVVIVASNHDEALDRWLREGEPNRDPKNARFFHEMRAAKLSAYEEDGAWTPALELLYRRQGKRRARFLRRNESHHVAGIECGFHGDKGVSGSRGSLLGYTKLGIKAVTGHSHSPAILDGTVCVGLSGKLDQGYNDLPSAWMHAHCLIYASGKRTLLFIRDGEWRVPAPAVEMGQTGGDEEGDLCAAM